MHLSFAAKTDVGRVRTHNEDNFLIDKHVNLFIVADGMGGHASGEIASAMAVNAIRETLLRDRKLIEDFHAGAADVDRRDILALLEQAVQAACYQVYENAQRHSSQKGMGTTVVLLLVARRRGFIAHVGDSRIYLARAGQVHQITEDHSLINELVRHGRGQTRGDTLARYKNAITRAVGIYESVDVDTLDLDLLPGDRFLLATDGLTGYLNDAKLLELLGDNADDPEAVVARLIEFANEQGGKDNITALYVAADQADAGRDFEAVRAKLSTFKGLALFRYLSYQDIVKLMNIATERQFAAGEWIFRENAREDSLYIIYQGNVQILKGDVEITVLGPGANFGEMALVDQSPRSASVLALDDVRALVITRRAFYEILRKNQPVAVKLLWSFLKVLTARLRSTSDELRLIKLLYQQKAVEESEAEDLLPSNWLEPMAEPEALVPATVPPPEGAELGPEPVPRSGAAARLMGADDLAARIRDTAPTLPNFAAIAAAAVAAASGQAPPPIPSPPAVGVDTVETVVVLEPDDEEILDDTPPSEAAATVESAQADPDERGPVPSETPSPAAGASLSAESPTPAVEPFVVVDPDEPSLGEPDSEPAPVPEFAPLPGLSDDPADGPGGWLSDAELVDEDAPEPEPDPEREPPVTPPELPALHAAVVAGPATPEAGQPAPPPRVPERRRVGWDVLVADGNDADSH